MRTQTALLYAAKHNQHLMVADLIGLGANINETNRWGKSCLHLSAENGYVRVLEVSALSWSSDIDSEFAVNLQQWAGRSVIIIKDSFIKNAKIYARNMFTVGLVVCSRNSTALTLLGFLLCLGNREKSRVLTTSWSFCVRRWAHRQGDWDCETFWAFYKGRTGLNEYCIRRLYPGQDVKWSPCHILQ